VTSRQNSLSEISVHIKYVDGSAPNLIHLRPLTWHFLSVKIETARPRAAARRRHRTRHAYPPHRHLATLTATQPTHAGRLGHRSSPSHRAPPGLATWATLTTTQPLHTARPNQRRVLGVRRPADTTTRPCRVRPCPARRPPAHWHPRWCPYSRPSSAWSRHWSSQHCWWPPSSSRHRSVASSSSLKRRSLPQLPHRPAQVPKRSLPPPLPPHYRCRLVGQRGGHCPHCLHCPIIHQCSRNLHLHLHYSIWIVDCGAVYLA
jgi:hypothetical protein